MEETKNIPTVETTETKVVDFTTWEDYNKEVKSYGSEGSDNKTYTQKYVVVASQTSYDNGYNDAKKVCLKTCAGLGLGLLALGTVAITIASKKYEIKEKEESK